MNEFFVDGPPTLAPIPMAAVSGYFASYQSETGRRARVFNIISGITTLVTALVPLGGPSLKDAEVVFSGGFTTGLGQAWPDLSPQQLQHLTSLSWGDSENVAANGGSVSKYIYIQRTRQFNDTAEPTSRSSSSKASVRLTTKQISNILSIDVKGWVVPDTPAVDATPQTPASQPTAPTGSSSSKPSGQ
ncbi:MAG TPA: hypothetical protein VJA16_04855 [Thermoanaerobaculia bacterium]